MTRRGIEFLLLKNKDRYVFFQVYKCDCMRVCVCVCVHVCMYKHVKIMYTYVYVYDVCV